MFHKLSFVPVIASSLASLALLAGCGSSNHAVATNPGNPTTPTSPSNPSSSSAISVASVTPAAGTKNVPLNSTIQITFSSAASATSVNSANIQVTDPKPVAGTVTYNSTTNTATFAPSAPLVANSTYTVTVSGVTSASGSAMSSTFSFAFATAAPAATPPGPTTSPTMQFQVTLFGGAQAPGTVQLTIDTAGAVKVQLTGALASSTLNLQFCPAYLIYTQTPIPCFSVGTVNTDASGNGTATMQFPQPGSWAGEFDLGKGTTMAYSSDVIPAADPGGSSQVYTSTLQPETTVNGKKLYAGSTTPQGPLTSGTVTYSNGSLQFTLTGAAPNTTFTANESGVLGGSSSYLLYNSQHVSAFTTDAKGDVSFSVLQDKSDGDVFEVFAQNGATIGFIGGFSIPK